MHVVALLVFGELVLRKPDYGKSAIDNHILDQSPLDLSSILGMRSDVVSVEIIAQNEVITVYGDLYDVCVI